MKTIVKESRRFELAHLKKKKEARKKKNVLTDFLVRYFCNAFFEPVGVLFIIKTLKNEWYVVKANKFTAFEILRFFIIIYCVSMLSLH